MTDAVNHPQHYGGKDNPYEAIKVIEAWCLGFCLGNTLKYISRAGKKIKHAGGSVAKAKTYALARRNAEKEIEDLKKAAWYLNHHIEMLIENEAFERGG